MIVHLTCNYCDYKWERYAYTKGSIADVKCPKCGDKDLKARPLDEEKIDYYQGSPAFPKKEEEKVETDSCFSVRVVSILQ